MTAGFSSGQAATLSTSVQLPTQNTTCSKNSLFLAGSMVSTTISAENMCQAQQAMQHPITLKQPGIPCTPEQSQTMPSTTPSWTCCHCREECDQYISSLWDWLEGLGTGIRRDDSSTWTEESWPSTYRGILNTLEIAHQSFVWRVRKQRRLQKVGATGA